MRYRGLYSAVGFVAVLLVLSGCIMPVPYYEKPPFWSQPDNLRFIKQGRTDKNEVLARLGMPAVRRADDCVWAYGEGQIRGVLLSSSGGGALEEQHVLLIAFDTENVVRTLGIYQDTHGCVSTGICFNTHWGSVTNRAQIDEFVLEAVDFFEIATGSSARVALDFELPTEGCRLYLYSSLRAPRATTRLWDGTAAQGAMRRWWILSGPYFAVEELPIGHYRLTISTEPSSLEVPSAPPASSDGVLDIVCETPALIFVQRELRTGFWSLKHRLREKQINEAIDDLQDYTLVQQRENLGWISLPVSQVENEDTGG